MIELSRDGDLYTFRKNGFGIVWSKEYIESITISIFATQLKDFFAACDTPVSSAEIHEVIAQIIDPVTPEGYSTPFITKAGSQIIIHHGDRYRCINYTPSKDGIDSAIKHLMQFEDAAVGVAEALSELHEELSELDEILSAKSSGIPFNNLAKNLPGVEYRTSCPAAPECSNDTKIYYLVQHLNDLHKWTRERIADWLEALHDPTGENGPNLNFQVIDNGLA